MATITQNRGLDLFSLWTFNQREGKERIQSYESESKAKRFFFKCKSIIKSTNQQMCYIWTRKIIQLIPRDGFQLAVMMDFDCQLKIFLLAKSFYLGQKKSLYLLSMKLSYLSLNQLGYEQMHLSRILQQINAEIINDIYSEFLLKSFIFT